MIVNYLFSWYGVNPCLLRYPFFLLKIHAVTNFPDKYSITKDILILLQSYGSSYCPHFFIERSYFVSRDKNLWNEMLKYFLLESFFFFFLLKITVLCLRKQRFLRIHSQILKVEFMGRFWICTDYLEKNIRNDRFTDWWGTYSIRMHLMKLSHEFLCNHKKYFWYCKYLIFFCMFVKTGRLAFSKETNIYGLMQRMGVSSWCDFIVQNHNDIINWSKTW